ncbi:MAG TPA: hypothetical protein VK249_21175 [Anaerolineales bacterium]|nr:hypothetical protein [Anaerolineales bacterium]
MIQYGTWRPYTGSDALLLAATLLLVAGALAYLGTRLPHPVAVQRPGRTVSLFLVLIWLLSFLVLGIAVAVYVKTLFDQVGKVSLPDSPVAPITYTSALIAFLLITFLNRQRGLKIALGSALVGTIAAPMIFELPFDLIVMWRTYAPTPAVPFTLLYFLPLFLWEISSFSLLTLSSLARLSKFTLFSLAAMFLVFAIWAIFGFSYPFTPLPLAFNALAKMLCFITAITLFLHRRSTATLITQSSSTIQPA